jgi:hypothetical protein
MGSEWPFCLVAIFAFEAVEKPEKSGDSGCYRGKVLKTLGVIFPGKHS